MSKKTNVPPKSIGERIVKARREKRTQQALELARTLYKTEPTNSHREILRQVSMERALALRAVGYLKDAATLYANALALADTPDFIAAAIRGLAACGAVSQATAALDQIADATERQKILSHIVDGAVAQGAKDSLPEPLHAQFDLIVQAFHAYETGHDDDARAALQSIGLQSPFLEWKVLLRGLIAYQTNDNARALENWQRLDPSRTPARLCAPLRAGIDTAFLNSQTPAAQHGLRTLLLQQQGVTVTPALCEVRELLHSENLGPAFRKVESVVPILRRDYPELAKRLAHVFFWTIINVGQPEDIDRYLRIFGAPADDPNLNRLQALATESRGLWPEAHQAWQSFIQDIVKSPKVWPDEIGKRMQALIWSRMAENAMPHRPRKGHSGNPLFDLFADHPEPLKPSAEQCLENAVKLAPDQIESQRALFEIYRLDGKVGKAKKIAQGLLKRFPDDFQTLNSLAELCVDNQEHKQALMYLEKAMQANPLNRDLPGIAAIVRQRWGLQLTLEGHFDEARAQFDQALKSWSGSKTPLLCQWAACELKAKNPTRAEELIAQALAAPDQRLAGRYALVGESIRAKLPPADKKRIAADLKSALTETPTPAEVVTLIYNAAQQHVVHDEAFLGQKTQEKTILKFLDQIHFDAFDERQLVCLTQYLQTLEARKPWLNCLNHARRRFLKNPAFRLSFVDYYLTENTDNPKTHLAREHLDAARRIVNDMPRGDAQQRLLDEIQDKDELVAKFESRQRGMMDVIDRIFGNFGHDPDDDNDFEEDDDDYF